MTDRLHVVRTFATDLDADLAQAVLAAHGIDALVLRDSAAGMLPSLNTMHPIRLAVDVADAELAAQLLAEDATGPGDDDGGEAT